MNRRIRHSIDIADNAGLSHINFRPVESGTATRVRRGHASDLPD